MSDFNFESYLDSFVAQNASNNWRRMHGYPLRRKMHNKNYKDVRNGKVKNPMVLGKAGCGKARTFCMPNFIGKTEET